MKFGMQRTTRSDGPCIAVSGEVDAYTAPELRDQLLDDVRGHPVVTVDLSAVTFMDSQGLAALLRARQEAESRGGSLRLEGVPSRVLKLFQLTRLDSVFTIHSTSTER
jgi:anti-sigma B factor antagonist